MTGPLGILQLADTSPVAYGGAISDPAVHPYGLMPLQVPGSSSERVFGDDQDVVQLYIDAARELEKRGAAAITSNCGFSARFQREVAAAVSVPVGLSSLIMVPFAERLIPPTSRVGVITYDSRRLGERHFRGVGCSLDESRIVIRGIEGTTVWQELKKPEPKIDPDEVAQIVAFAARSIIAEDPSIRALILECSIFPMASSNVRRNISIPVFDFLSVARLIMGARE